jgi:hypothetical protein
MIKIWNVEWQEALRNRAHGGCRAGEAVRGASPQAGSNGWDDRRAKPVWNGACGDERAIDGGVAATAHKTEFQLRSAGPVFTVAPAKYPLQFILPAGVGICDLAKKGFRRLLGVGNDGVLLLLLQDFFHWASVDSHIETLLHFRPAAAESM